MLIYTNLSNFEKFFFSDFWPDYLFINNYPVLVVFWNLLLLLAPYLIIKFLEYYWKPNNFKKWQEKFILGVFFLIWLLFIPNSAYIITEVRHLHDYCPGSGYLAICPENAWMVMFFFVYSLIGWISFVYLLNQMRNFMEKSYNKLIAEVFVISVIPIITAGMLLGLINRWNSWETFTHPFKILNDLSLYFTNLMYLKNLLIFIIGLYILYFTGNYLFKRINSK